MNCLFRYSLDNKLPIDLIYMRSNGEITQRSVIVLRISVDGILAFDLNKQQVRSFKLANVLSAAKKHRKRGVHYASII